LPRVAGCWLDLLVTPFIPVVRLYVYTFYVYVTVVATRLLFLVTLPHVCCYICLLLRLLCRLRYVYFTLLVVYVVAVYICRCVVPLRLLFVYYAFIYVTDYGLRLLYVTVTRVVTFIC